jgi:hypothetical protein
VERNVISTADGTGTNACNESLEQPTEEESASFFDTGAIIATIIIYVGFPLSAAALAYCCRRHRGRIEYRCDL